MAGHGKQDDQPWYRTTTAIFTAGGIGAALLAGLVFAIVEFSDEWSSPAPPVFTTAVSLPPAPSTDREPFVITPSESSTTFTTSVPLSTTEISIPTGPSDSGTTSSTPTTTTTATITTTTTDDGHSTDGHSTTTRKRPRLNETRTYSP